MKKLLLTAAVLGIAPWTQAAAPTLENEHVAVSIDNRPDALWSLALRGAEVRQAIVSPTFEIDGSPRPLRFEALEVARPRTLANGVVEHVATGPVSGDPALELRLVVRLAPGSPLARFRYELSASEPRALTKSGGQDGLTYFSTHLAPGARAVEVRLSEFDPVLHSFRPSEREVRRSAFENRLMVPGPILVAEGASTTAVFACEHGSQLPDYFVGYRLSPGRGLALEAVKGNYLTGHQLDREPYRTFWMEVGLVSGDRADAARALRSLVLEHMSESAASSRRPYVFYNTWNFQERNQAWNGQPYLASMNRDRMLEEIEVAHRMGIEVFVIDTGWYEKTGDWAVNRERFPDGLKEVKARLDEHGMKLGLWFTNKAAVSSRSLREHPHDMMTWDGRPRGPGPVWETEDSYSMCLVSSWADAYAEELIRLSRELGVSYFKWDAIGQYGCNDPRHHHGDESHTPQERADSYSFQIVEAMARVADRITAARPDAIVDLDLTEGERAFGLGFLSSGKFFVVNNGPYYYSFDDPAREPGGGMGANVFVFPGAARARVAREPLDYDRWIPSVLLLAHYLPDDPGVSQDINLGSLVLGQNGLWGNLPEISDEGVARIRRTLDAYKQVREDMARAFPVRDGDVGAVPEIHEKIDLETGRGGVVLFYSYKSPWHRDDSPSFPGRFTYVTESVPSRDVWHNEGVAVTFDDAGRAVIEAEFDRPGARIVFFGVK